MPFRKSTRGVGMDPYEIPLFTLPKDPKDLPEAVIEVMEYAAALIAGNQFDQPWADELDMCISDLRAEGLPFEAGLYSREEIPWGCARSSGIFDVLKTCMRSAP